MREKSKVGGVLGGDAGIIQGGLLWGAVKHLGMGSSECAKLVPGEYI